jgi:hypothetical protein
LFNIKQPKVHLPGGIYAIMPAIYFQVVIVTEPPAGFTFSTKLELEAAVSTSRCRSCFDKGHLAKRCPKYSYTNGDPPTTAQIDEKIETGGNKPRE